MWHQLVNVDACLTTHCNAFVVWLDKTVRIMIQFIEKNPRPIIHSCMPAAASFVRSFIHSLIMTLLLNRQWIHVYLTTMCESCSSMSVHVLWITLRFMSTFFFFFCSFGFTKICRRRAVYQSCSSNLCNLYDVINNI